MKDLGKINYKYIKDPEPTKQEGLCVVVVFRKDISVLEDLLILGMCNTNLPSNVLKLKPCKFNLTTDVEKNEFILDIDTEILVDYKIKCHLFLVDEVYLALPDGRKVHNLYTKL
ncbi:hypothetical protein AGENTSMITH_145 [Bacillus phage vB_BspM_AgentSmith]|nr:hypothetical protein AGENTSMITH_145 [Bacillus phage vB_BspM_AgentSmith]